MQCRTDALDRDLLELVQQRRADVAPLDVLPQVAHVEVVLVESRDVELEVGDAARVARRRASQAAGAAPRGDGAAAAAVHLEDDALHDLQARRARVEEAGEAVRHLVVDGEDVADLGVPLLEQAERESAAADAERVGAELGEDLVVAVYTLRCCTWSLAARSCARGSRARSVVTPRPATRTYLPRYLIRK